MILRRTFYLLFFLSSLLPSNFINLDKHITSKLNTTDILFDGSSILVSTTGGVYSVVDGNYYDIPLIDAVNINSISSKDLNNNIWLSSMNDGIVQVLNSNNSISNIISYPFDIDSIYDVNHGSSSTFAIGCRGLCNDGDSLNDEYFIIKYDNYYYENIIQNFPGSFDYINDISIFNDTLYVGTNNGIFIIDINNNLLIPDNWIHKYENHNIIAVCEKLAITEDSFILLDDDVIVDYDNNEFDGAIIGLYDFFNDENFHLLTTDNLYLIYSNLVDFENITSYKHPDIINSFTSVAYGNNEYYFGLKNNGIVTYSQVIDSYSFYLPNTLFKNDFDAISISNDYLVGMSKSGGFIVESPNSRYTPNVVNFYPYAFSDTSLYSYKYPPSTSDYISITLPYWSGGKKQTSILINNDNILFSNTGSYPFIDDNITYHYSPIMNNFCSFDVLPDISHYGSLGSITLSLDNFELTMKSNGVVGGLGGYLYDNETSGYMSINQIKKDNNNNIWVVNPYSENYFINNERINRPLLFKKFNDLNWNHVYDESSQHYIPTDIAFSSNNRIWVGYRFYESENFIYSNGGIRLLEYNNIDNDIDDLWHNVYIPDYVNINIWSLAIGLDIDGREILWVLSDLGLKGYYFDIAELPFGDIDVNIYPYTDDYFFNNLTYREGCKIKVDYNNNVWLVTNNEGAKIVYRNGNIETMNINKEELKIVSNNVTDIDFDINGDVYISTDLGISILNTSFTSSYSPTSLSVSPNPFNINDNDEIIFSNIGPNTKIQLMTLSGIVLKDFFINYNSEKIEWDGAGNNGKTIPTGVYLIVSSNIKENSGISKIAIIK